MRHVAAMRIARCSLGSMISSPFLRHSSCGHNNLRLPKSRVKQRVVDFLVFVGTLISMARPPKPKGEARTDILRIRLTPGEKKLLDQIARSNGVDVSTWVRQQILGKRPRSKRS